MNRAQRNEIVAGMARSSRRQEALNNDFVQRSVTSGTTTFQCFNASTFQRAFSLIELLIVIAIIAILAALLLPVLNRAHEEGRATACVSNLHQIGLALQMYVDANNNTLPVMEDAPMNTNALATNAMPTVNVVLGTDLANTNVLHCPSDFQKIFQLTGSSYSWNNLLNGENASRLVVFGMTFRPQAIPVFFDKQGFHAARGPNKAVNYLYADQHIKNLLTVEGSLPQ